MTIKHIKISLLVLLSTFIISCSDDDTTNQTLSSSDIVGNWSLVEINSTPAVDLEDNGNSDPNVMNQTDCFDGMSLDFDNNGNVTAVSSEIDYDDSTSPSFNCSLRTDSGSYTLNNSDLSVTVTLDGSQETETLNVDLQNNTLSFIVTESDVADYFNVPSGQSFSSINELEFVYLKN